MAQSNIVPDQIQGFILREISMNRSAYNSNTSLKAGNPRAELIKRAQKEWVEHCKGNALSPREQQGLVEFTIQACNETK